MDSSIIRKNTNKNKKNKNKERKVPWKARKIEIKYIEKKESRMVTFTKRRNGLFSMASTLSELTKAEIAVIAISEAGRPYASGSMAVIDRFLPDEDNVEEPNPAGVEDWMDVINEEALADEGANLLDLKRQAECLRECLLGRLAELKEEEEDR